MSEEKREIDMLWAPWRMAYIVDELEDKQRHETLRDVDVGPEADCNCFLCQAVFDRTRDRARHVVRRAERTITVLNKFPYNNGHLLVAPCRHVARLDELDESVKSALFAEIDRLVLLLEKEMQPDGFNIGLNLGRSAGAGLPGHLHWHIVPRWNGDTNYITTVASTKVIPQALDALWEILVRE